MKKIKKNIKANSHSKHYLLHRYWGRKAHNVVAQYIQSYTKKNDLVLDPFMGSGVVPIECAKINRSCIGVDLNPISTFLVENTINTVDEHSIKNIFNDIFNTNKKKYFNFYTTKCPKCNENAIFENSVWKENIFYSLKVDCKNCGKSIKLADNCDHVLLKKIHTLFNKQKEKFFFPKEQILKYVKRSDKTHLNMLFTERAIIILGNIYKDIEKIENKKIKNNLKLCFSSMLASVSRMIPGDEIKVQGRSGWVVSKLWVPKIHTEKNIFFTFKNRFEKFIEGKKEANKLIDEKRIRIYNCSSENLFFIKDNSIDYIFTDPPYGQSISYFGLSMFWNAWLQQEVKYEDEIIYDPYRNKKYHDYETRLKNVFSEMYRVLKNNKYLSLTFHNRDMKIWEIVISNLKNIGFHLQNIVYQEQAVMSGTQGLNKKNTFRGDFVYNFLKDIKKKPKKLIFSKNVREKIIKKISQLLSKSQNGISSDKMYEELIPFIVNNNFYKDEMGTIMNIEEILNKNFLYKKNKKNDQYQWQIR